MKTNASPKTIIQAVETISKRNYEGNVVFRKTPEKMTKNVCRFTLKTLDVNKPGSLVTKQGVKQTKADWNVHQDVMLEILRLDPRPHIYVDTVYGRQYNKSPQPIEVHAENVEVNQEETNKETKKRKYTKRNAHQLENAETQDNPTAAVANIIQAIKYIMQHPNVLNE